jgi:uncharacterized integral membrane protein
VAQGNVMTIGTFLSTLAASLGFGASIFFVIGSIRLDVKAIFELASPHWDYHSEIAKVHCEQKWFYSFGAAILILAFIAQAVSLAPFEFIYVVLPTSPGLGFLVAGIVSILLWFICYRACKTMIQRTVEATDSMAKERMEQEERELAERNRPPGGIK